MPTQLVIRQCIMPRCTIGVQSDFARLHHEYFTLPRRSVMKAFERLSTSLRSFLLSAPNVKVVVCCSLYLYSGFLSSHLLLTAWWTKRSMLWTLNTRSVPVAVAARAGKSSETFDVVNAAEEHA